MGRGGRGLGFLYGVTVLVGVIWLLFVCTIAHHHATVATKSISVSSTKGFQHGEFVGQERLDSQQDFHLNSVSKRRVPNGPDPIHNRRASNSGRPPGRA